MKLHQVRLEGLIKRLKAERGMGRKVRLLAGAWPLLRELSPEERERVAVAVGSRWAWSNLAGMFGNAGELSEDQAQVKAMFERLGEADPQELRRLGKEIKKGGVAGVRSRLLDALEEAIDEEIDVERDLQEPGAEPEESGDPEISAEQSATTEAARTEQVLDSQEPAGESARSSEPDRPEPQRLEPLKPSTDEVAVLGLPATVEQVRVEEAPTDSRRRKAVNLSAVESLRALRQLSSGESALSRAERAELIGSLGSGWAARRAVSSMIRSHSVTDLDEALALIRRLTSATQQVWCLGDLLQHWQLDGAGRGRVLAAAPTEVAKNRLARRAARAS